jgi:acetyltransferase-like isoleucine patch superfamily enzyme
MARKELKRGNDMKKKFMVFFRGYIKFEYNTLKQLQKEALKYGASIGDDASIGYDASIGNGASILIRAIIKSKWIINKITHLMNEYKYHVSGFKIDGEIIIQMGCFTRLLKEWEDDFWNNPDEFKEGTPEGNDRLRAFNKIKTIMLLT